MAESLSDGSLNGQFGLPGYHSNEKAWHFERDVSNIDVFQPLGNPRLVQRPAIQGRPSGRIRANKEGASRRREKQAKALVSFYPEIQPALEHLPDLARVSEAIENATNQHDPTRGNLLAFGTIPNELTGSHIEVVAFPTGPTGGNLRVVQVQRQGRGWEDSKDEWLAVPTIHGEEAVWEGPGVSIESIAFSEPKTRGGIFLVLRLLAEILIFRPILRRSTSYRRSRLDLELVLRLSLDVTNGITYAHVAFNPWNDRQLALIDQIGSWSVKRLDINPAVSFESIFDSKMLEDLADVQLVPMDDGWARIMWAGNEGLIVVCSRRKIMVVDLSGLAVRSFPKAQSLLTTSMDWNLDLAVPHSREDLCVLLTSTNLYIYRVGKEKDGALSVTVAASVRHFLSPDDISLRLNVFQDNDGELG